MESDPKYFRVGSFVIICTILLLIFVLWLSGVQDSRNQKTYTIYFRQQTLDGLQKDSFVTMKGIKVGDVLDTKRKDLAKTFVASSDEVETPAEQPAETSGDENVDSVQPTEQPDTGA